MINKVEKFFAIFFLILFFGLGMNLFQNKLEDFFYAQIGQPFEEISFAKIPPREEKPRLELQAKSAISFKVNKFGREKALLIRNSHLALPIASLTKLMTAVIILEDPNYDLENTWVTISEKAAEQEDVPNFGNLKAGEGFPVKTLLDLMLIYSSNDAAFALSELIGVDNFVAKMNQKAEELSLEETRFVNPTGLDPEDIFYNPANFNYSTGQDLVKLSQYIFENHPLIFEISLRGGPYAVYNGISSLSSPEDLKILGGKTGYTEEAGGCILLILEDEKENNFFNVILGTSTVEDRIKEVQKLIDWLNKI
jgi:D-alanyl-D-alanine carboxypeptidase